MLQNWKSSPQKDHNFSFLSIHTHSHTHTHFEEAATLLITGKQRLTEATGYRGMCVDANMCMVQLYEHKRREAAGELLTPPLVDKSQLEKNLILSRVGSAVKFLYANGSVGMKKAWGII